MHYYFLQIKTVGLFKPHFFYQKINFIAMATLFEKLEKDIAALAESFLAENQATENAEDPLYLVGVIAKGNAKTGMKVSVLVDADKGITIEDCARLSRFLGHEMEERNMIEGKYNLEVSSPGVDFPLSGLRQYKKNIGRDLKVEIKGSQGVAKNHTIIGELQAVSPEGITLALPVEKQKKKTKPKPGEAKTEDLAPADNIKEIPFAHIAKAIVQVRF